MLGDFLLLLCGFGTGAIVAGVWIRRRWLIERALLGGLLESVGAERDLLARRLMGLPRRRAGAVVERLDHGPTPVQRIEVHHYQHEIRLPGDEWKDGE